IVVAVRGCDAVMCLDMKRFLTWLAPFCLSSLLTADAADLTGKLELKPADHVALIGNTLADRFQHSGWLETFIYSKYPNHNLVFRNLAVAGDEVAARHRPADFGSQDQWLKKVGANVIFAFLGFNE